MCFVNAFGLAFENGFKEFKEFNVPSIAITAATVITSVGIFVLVGTYDPSAFDFFLFSFKKSKIALKHVFFFYAALLSTVASLTLLPKLPYLSVIPFALLTLYTAIARPFLENRESVRSALCSTAIAVTVGMRTLLKFSNEPTNSQSTFVYFLSALIAVFCALLFSLLCFVYHCVFIFYIKPKMQRGENLKIMEDLEFLHLRTRMGIVDADANVFKTMVAPRMSLIDFSNRISSIYAQTVIDEQGIRYNPLNKKKLSIDCEDDSMGVQKLSVPSIK